MAKLKIEALLKIRYEEIIRIAKGHGAERIRVFGSAAEGKTTKSSDLDLLVSMKPGSSLLDIIAIKQDLEELLGCAVDVVTEDALSPYMRDEVLKKAVNL